MIPVWSRLLETLDAQGAAALVSVVAVSGSAPREPGARMVVRPDGGFWGTVGGGELEWRLLAAARSALEAGRGAATAGDWPLGPDLGQCCGGRVQTWIEVFDARDRSQVAAFAEAEATGFEAIAVRGSDGRIERTPAAAPHALPPGAPRGVPALFSPVRERFGDDSTPLLLFGAGHVGRALALALAPLPFRIAWFDDRPAAFPSHAPQNAVASLLGAPEAAVAGAPVGALVMVMTHSHPLDLAIVTAALGRADLGPVGLIGSATKRARFLARLRSAGLGNAAADRLVCPIGVPGIGGKEPAVIAAAAAAQLLQWREAAGSARRPFTEAASQARPRRSSGERA